MAKKTNWNKLLGDAAAKGDLAGIEEALANGAAVTDPDDWAGRQPPIVLAAQGGQVEAVLRLLSHGADPCAQRPDSMPALIKALEERHHAVVQALAHDGRAIDPKQGGIAPSIAFAIHGGDPQDAQLLLSLDPEWKARRFDPDHYPWVPLQYHDRDNRGGTGHGCGLLSPLQLAAARRNLPAVRELLAAGADPGEANSLGLTPLHLVQTSWTPHQKVIVDISATLLAYGAPPEPENKRGRKPPYVGIAAMRAEVDQAAERVRARLAKVAASKAPKKPTSADEAMAMLAQGARSGDIAQVRAAIGNGADPGKRLVQEKTLPLHLAAEFGHLDIIDYLLQHGVDINQSDEKGRTALYVATRKNQGDAVAALIAAGAIVHAPQLNGRYEMLWTVYTVLKHEEGVRAILQAIVAQEGVERIMEYPHKPLDMLWHRGNEAALLPLLEVSLKWPRPSAWGVEWIEKKAKRRKGRLLELATEFLNKGGKKYKE